MVPNKFNMIDLDGLDIIESQGVIVTGLYDKLVESIALCRYQCIYNWKFNSIPIPPTYVELDSKADGVWINDGIVVSQDDTIHIYTIEPDPPVINPLNVVSNGVYNVSEGVTGFNPVTVQVPPPFLVGKKITENGIYYPGEGEDGFSYVEVEVEGGTMERTELFFSENGAASGTLSADITSFDYVEFELVHVDGQNKYSYCTIWPKVVMETTLAGTSKASICAYANAYFNLVLPTTTSFSNSGVSGVTPRRITGINFSN